MHVWQNAANRRSLIENHAVHDRARRVGQQSNTYQWRITQTTSLKGSVRKGAPKKQAKINWLSIKTGFAFFFAIRSIAALSRRDQVAYD